MTDFDPIKAAREELSGLHDVLTAMRRGENQAEQAMARAESDLNAIRKLRGYAQLEIERLQARIASMEAEKNQS
jgi:chromosome segregation ATPase